MAIAKNETEISEIKNKITKVVEDYDDIIKKNVGIIQGGIPSKEVQIGEKLKQEGDDFFQNKRKITEIWVRYFELMTLISVAPGIRETFFSSSENRRELLVERNESDPVFVRIKEHDKIKEYFLNKQEYNDLSDEYKDYFFEFHGVGMSIPKSAYVTINPNSMWASIYIKSKLSESQNNGTDEEDFEISVYEQPWHLELLTNSEDANSLIELTPPKKGNVKIGPYIISKSEAFSRINVKVLKELASCNVVIEIPLITPSEDMLTEVSFAGGNSPEIVLSSC